MGGSRKSRILIAAGLLALTTAAPAAAQNGRSGEAEALETRAAALEEVGPAGFSEAASLYRKAADLRIEGDPQAVRDLMKSGKLSFYAGKRDRAIGDLVRAADMALAFGDVLSAATAYLDAGWIANEAGDGARAYALAVKGARLSQSPLIEASQRKVLEARVEGSLVS
ncbi:MAG: hypothetical protein KY453_10555 [Gemmatimonadetes bacterium]|nr:hypothetical protein [Gemmatimonadota bacterium]